MWNSTFLMVEGVIYYRHAFLSLRLADSNHKYCPSEEECDRADKISKFSEIFHNVTCIFFGLKPYSNLYLSQVFMAQQALSEAM